MPRPRCRRNISKRPRSFTPETAVYCPGDRGLLLQRPRSFTPETAVSYPRDRGLLPKRPRSIALETAVFYSRDRGLLLQRPRSLLLLLPIPDVGSGLRACFGQGGSVFPTATEDCRPSVGSPLPGSETGETRAERSLLRRDITNRRNSHAHEKRFSCR